MLSKRNKNVLRKNKLIIFRHKFFGISYLFNSSHYTIAIAPSQPVNIYIDPGNTPKFMLYEMEYNIQNCIL